MKTMDKRTKLPKFPFCMGDKASYIRKALVAVTTAKVEMAEMLSYSVAYNRVETIRVPLDEIAMDHQSKQYYVDGGHTVQGPTGMAKTHLQWLRDAALKGGATPDAIRLLEMVTPKFTNKEKTDMAKKATSAKLARKNTTADAGGEPVGGGGAVATASKAKGKGAARKGNPEALKKAREAKAAAGPDTRKIRIINKENPYRENSNRAASFNALKGAKTVEDYVAAGGKTKYLSRWASEGRISLG
jgi:hypothetical protein